MAVVTEHLVQLIAKQVDDKGLVVWYDPEKAYDAAVAELTLPNTTVAHYEGSFLQLRKEIDHLLNDGQPPRLVVYVPVEREKTYSALIELDCAGIVMQPRQQPPACNTRLSVLARNALKPILGEDQVGEIERQVESGKLSLADLNSLAEQGIDISTGVLKLIFDSANPQEVALAFLHSDQHDEEVGKKDAQKELRHLLQISFDIELPAADALSNWRLQLSRHVLLTDLLTVLNKQVPVSLSSVPVANSNGGIDACIRLARTWRNDREVRDSYVTVANKVEQELGLDQLEFPVEPLTENETFPCIERALLIHVESELLKSATSDLLELAEYRLSRFWADVVPAIQARWALISSSAEVLVEADRVGKALKNAPTTVPALVRAYADDDEPWCLLDTHHRHMESRKYNFEFAASNDHHGLEKLITKAEQRYTEVGSELAKHFITQFSKAKHPIKGLLRQRDIFEKQVKPLLGEGKVAYVWVDALRFEMARGLCRLLSDDFKLEVQPAIGTMPTITEIGMAALLPKAHESAKVVSVGGGKLALEIDGKVIKNRKDRVAFLKEHAGVKVFDTKLDDLLPKPAKKVRDGIQNADLILITSQEIDELGEADNMSQARLQIDGVLSHLRRGVRILADQGIKTIVLVADHGHLFADEIGEDMKIEAPGGKAEDLHRRVWVGSGGTSEPSYLRTSLTSLGIESEFDIATPWTFAVFKSKGGGRAYFHGGLSPQELIVPMVVLHSTAKPSVQTTGIQWTLTPGTAKLTTRFFSVQIAGSQSESSLFGFEPPKIRIELRASKKCVSLPVSASYGFEDATGEVNLKISEEDNKRIEPNTVTVMLSEEISQKTVGVYLLDATTGVELAAPLTVDVAISM
ncbi:PglZ domain-containing protein [Gimesia chilikensis]|uniref:PglZ domain protein n=1 Tax=Gimesia chilikensis TaxID=2605989 RepID=A0A517PYE5_9PLAN|nr:PglZ domain-containing protein [Gimesia chilikensis]QDT24364.1 PglZ domain protein [Gimesia chilikensis]